MKNLIIWICNGVVALLSILAIAGCFFSPFWSINVSYTLQEDDLETLIGDSSKDMNVKEIIGEEGVPLNVTLNVDGGILFQSFGSSAENTMETLVNENVDSIIDQLMPTFKELAPKIAKSVTKQKVRENVHSQVQNYLDSIGAQTDKTVEQRLKDAGVDELLDERINSIVDNLLENGSAHKDEVREEILQTVDDVYDKMQAGTDEDLGNIEFSEQNREEIKESLDEILDRMADDNGEIDIDELLNRLLSEGMDALNGDDKAASGGIALLADDGTSNDSTESLKQAAKKYIRENLPENIGTYVWVIRGILILWMISSAAWIYILVKLIFKLVKRDEPTVKLKMPIILGWLPFLVLVILPALVFSVFKGSLTGALSPTIAEKVMRASISFASSGWIALMAAVICIGISIFYIILRKRSKE